MKDLYVKLAHKYGTNLDLFPSGGGNISIKDNNYIYIKKSGTAVVDGLFVRCDMNDINENEMPSIEIWFHLFMKKFTVHMHPKQLGKLLYDNSMMDDNETIYIKYMNPGKELAEEIKKKYTNQSIIFLINHGIIFTSNSLDELHELIIKTLKIDGSIFQLQDITGKLVWKSRFHLNKEKLKYYIPDIPVYLGYEVININEIDIYKDKYQCYPILIEFNNQLFIIANNKKKFYDIEEMISFYLNNTNMNTTINYSDIKELMNWDKEKYRQEL